MICLQVRIIGFIKDSNEKIHSLCIDANEKVAHILEYLEKEFNITFDLDEVMILCNDRQVYVDEPIPGGCDILTVFPLALGGLE